MDIKNIEFSVEELFEKREILDVVVIEKCNKKVVSLAKMNLQAFKKTLESNTVYYYDPHNDIIYLKGEHSKKIEKILDIELDMCPGRRHNASLLIQVEMAEGECLFGMDDCYLYKYENGKFVLNKDKIHNKEAFDKQVDRLGKIFTHKEEKEDFKKRFNKDKDS